MNDVRINVPQFRNRTTVVYNADDMEWQTDAKCRNHDPEQWFPEQGGMSGKHQAEKAIAICDTCPLTAHKGCARLALDLKSQYGVWAGIHLGTTSISRAAARKRLLVIAGITQRSEAN